MTIENYESELRALVRSATGLISTYWAVAPDNSTYPLVILNHISSQIDYTQDGMDEVNSSLIQIDIYTKSFTQSVDARNGLIAGLDNYKGEFIFGTFIKNIRNGVDTTTDDKLFRYLIEVEVFH